MWIAIWITSLNPRASGHEEGCNVYGPYETEEKAVAAMKALLWSGDPDWPTDDIGFDDAQPLYEGPDGYYEFGEEQGWIKEIGQ